MKRLFCFLVMSVLCVACQQKPTRVVYTTWERPLPPADPEETTLTTHNDFYVVGYVASWSDMLPNPFFATHLNYAFAHIGRDLKSIRIEKPMRLKRIAALKKDNPELKVLLSIGGWASGHFSEMASDAKHRAAFAKECRHICDHYGLDGIDIDWEYPGSSTAGIVSSPNDIRNFTLLMHDLREALGYYRVLSYASVASAEYIDHPAALQYANYVNVMAYDMGTPPNRFNAAMRRSSKFECLYTVEESVRAHMEAGVPAHRLVLGMPFYGRGCEPYGRSLKFVKNRRPLEGCRVAWDNDACVPYIVNGSGVLVCTYEDERSIAEKCTFIKENELLGGMFWEASADDENYTLSRTVANILLR